MFQIYMTSKLICCQKQNLVLPLHVNVRRAIGTPENEASEHKRKIDNV